jgi:hypothetical protein
MLFCVLFPGQSNRLTKMEGLSTLTNLQELYLAHNGFDGITGLETLTALNTLDLSANRITTVSGLTSLTGLTDVWVRAVTHRFFMSVAVMFGCLSAWSE